MAAEERTGACRPNTHVTNCSLTSIMMFALLNWTNLQQPLPSFAQNHRLTNRDQLLGVSPGHVPSWYYYYYRGGGKFARDGNNFDRGKISPPPGILRLVVIY